MTKVDIDKLEGVQLDLAVCDALGWVRSDDMSPMARQCHYDENKTTLYWLHDFGRCCIIGNQPIGEWIGGYCYFEPHRDIKAAWRLDKPGWRWTFAEGRDGWTGKIVLDARVKSFDPVIRCGATVNLDDFTDKSHAYATARSRAFLKAVGWEG